MNDTATCKTCPWWVQTVELLVQANFYVDHGKGECRRNAPIPSPEDSSSWWPVTYAGDWCGEHPDRQPRLECMTTTLVTAETDGPTAADMRRIVDALEKLVSRAMRAKP